MLMGVIPLGLPVLSTESIIYHTCKNLLSTVSIDSCTVSVDSLEPIQLYHLLLWLGSGSNPVPPDLGADTVPTALPRPALLLCEITTDY